MLIKINSVSFNYCNLVSIEYAVVAETLRSLQNTPINMDVAQLDIKQVYSTLTAALSLSNERSAAEAQLRSWETDSAAGFIGSLLKVASEVQSVPEVRLYTSRRTAF